MGLEDPVAASVESGRTEVCVQLEANGAKQSVYWGLYLVWMACPACINEESLAYIHAFPIKVPKILGRWSLKYNRQNGYLSSNPPASYGEIIQFVSVLLTLYPNCSSIGTAASGVCICAIARAFILQPSFIQIFYLISASKRRNRKPKQNQTYRYWRNYIQPKRPRVLRRR